LHVPLFGDDPDKLKIRDETIKPENREIFFAKILDHIQQRHNVYVDSCYFTLKGAKIKLYLNKALDVVQKSAFENSHIKTKKHNI